MATNLDKKIKSCCSVDDLFLDLFLLNLTIYEFMMIRKQYHNNVFYAGQRGNYLCT